MKDIYELFEFNLIKEKIKEFAYSELALKYIDNLVMFNNEDDLKDNLELMKEVLSYTYKYGRINIFNHGNVLPDLINIQRDGVGRPQFFSRISYLLENIKLIKEDFKEKDHYQKINDLINQLNPLVSLKNKIDKIVSPDLEILSTASNNLMRIRTKISRLESGISSLINSLIEKYRNYLSDFHPTIRNGVYALMVKASFKNRISGITLASSDSGNTFFIEPQELIELYNNIASLKEEEKTEIESILRDLSKNVKDYLNELKLDALIVASLDFNFAKASYGVTYQGNMATLLKEKKISLLNSAHPLIPLSKVVRNDFTLEKERMMVITGPNAGGKTVALKLIGLLVIMNQCALPLPTEENPLLPFFENIYADIGDNQSLIDNLSTFSSHIVNLQKILSSCNQNSLVIIDELGSGTSPLDGEALALGSINYLIDKKCFAFISSHYEGVKNYALENRNILCTSMLFDQDKMIPTYRLLLNAASSSFGVEVAERLNLEKDVIEFAKRYIKDKKSTDEEFMLEDLINKIRENELIKQDLKKRENELKRRESELIKQINDNKLLHQKILEQAEDEKQKIVNKAQEEIDEIFEQFKRMNDVKLHQVIEAKKKIGEKLSTDEEEIVSNDIINIGDNVEIIDTNTRGKVVSIKKDRVTIINSNGINIEVKKNKLRKLAKINEVNKVQIRDFYDRFKTVKSEINIIGMTVKDSLPLVSKFLDDAKMAHLSMVRIIHGSGTGKLREGIHKYLKTSPYVSSFRLGGIGEGGVGATVVTLK